ncbi:MAG: glucose-6-phosphate dehydrogenase [Bacteroidota bacterium]|nr:glucose-6-phosphate dehydrogenase [Bacteroidota bacterium]
MDKSKGLILVIFGASGDLTVRKLIPALCDLKNQQLLPKNFAVLGVGRTEMDDKAFQEKMLNGIREFLSQTPCAIANDSQEEFLSKLHYISINTSDSNDYARLKQRLSALDSQYNTSENYLFYLATPPNMYEVIINNLGSHELNKNTVPDSWKRIIIEKPFGYDLNSARDLNSKVLKVFSEDQVYRIDHYLGKETVQNILVTRFSNGIFEPLWNRNFIHHIEVTSAESIGVENRGGYYDTAGALRDMIQNHLLQIVALVAMEPPATSDARSIRNETLKVFQSLRPLTETDIEQNVIRGQYTASTIKGKQMAGYRDEANVGYCSKTETYVAMKFFIDNWRWSDVPFYIRTGKHLPIRVTEIVIHFKPSPHVLFTKETGVPMTSNQLVIRIQPDEGILLKFGMKVPGSGFKVQEVGMDFHYSQLSDKRLPDAYERLLLDCILGDATLFSRGDSVEATWSFIDPILKLWKEKPQTKLFGYPAGTWGPENADSLIDSPDHTWRYPCKNLTADSNYCEL